MSTPIAQFDNGSPRAIVRRASQRLVGAKALAEASVLVLGGNPLDDFGAARDIRQRIKQGHRLGAPAS